MTSRADIQKLRNDLGFANDCLDACKRNGKTLSDEVATLRREVAAWRALAEHAAPGERAYMFGLYHGARRMSHQHPSKFEPLGIGPDFGAAAIAFASELKLIPPAPKPEDTDNDPDQMRNDGDTADD